MPNELLLQELEKTLKAVEELQQKELLLGKKLNALVEQCKAQKWLTDGSAETAAAEICQLVGAQQKIAASESFRLNDTIDLIQAKDRLATEVQRVRISLGEGQIVQRFCALESSDEKLTQLLPDRKARLKALMEPGADEEERKLWLDACRLLLDQLENPDIARSQELLMVFLKTLGVEFLTGIFSGKLTLPADRKSGEPLPFVPEPMPVSETVPPSTPDAKPARGFSEPQSDVSFEGVKRNQEPSGKRLGELLKQHLFQGVLTRLKDYLVVSEETLDNDGLVKKASSVAQDGYLTKITLRGTDPRVFYQASARLCAGVKKQSVQEPLYKAGFHGLDFQSNPEEWFTAGLLKQVDLVQQSLLLLAQDCRLDMWTFGRKEPQLSKNCYRLNMTFRADYSEDVSVDRCIVSLEGVEDLESAQERLNTPNTVWVVVPRQEDIQGWIERLKTWNLPLPEWIALDAPEDYFLKDGERRALTELFPDALERPNGEKPVAEEVSAPEAGAVEKQPPTVGTEPDVKKAAEEKTVEKALPVQPAPAKAVSHLGLFELDKPKMDFQEQTAQWAAEEKFPLALCLIRSAADYDPALAGLQEQLAYALDDPMENCEYLDDRLSDVYASTCEGPWGDQQVFQFLRTSAFLRMAFSNVAGQQSYRIADSLQGFSVEGMTPSLGSAFHLLSQFVRTQRRGVDRQMIRQIRQQGDVSDSLSQLAKEADSTLGRRWNESDHKMERIKLMFDRLFGSQSDMMRFLKSIGEQKMDARKEIAAFCMDHQLIDADGLTDRTGIGRFIDLTWESLPAKRGKNSNVTGNARAQAVNRMIKCVDICAKWLELTEGSPISDIQEVAEQCDRLGGYLTKAQEELTAQSLSGTYLTAAKAVLSQTLTDLINALKGTFRDRDAYYADFLYTGYIELDGDFCPVLERPEHIIPGCEPWERLRCHDEAMTRDVWSWDAPVERILGSDEEQPDYRNFGSAQLIQQHCEKQGLAVPARLAEARLEDDDRRTLSKVKEKEERFRAELELAATYGQIEDNTHKERLVTAITKQRREHFDETRNWGCYFLIMRTCLEAVRKNAERLEPRYRYEFDQLKQNMDDCPLFQDIERMLKQKMFSVAHDYIQLAIKENITEAPQGNDLQRPLGKDGLHRFLEAYNTLQHRSAEKKDREPLYVLAKSLGFREAGENWKKLLDAWPQNGQTDESQLKILFEAMNFPVARVEARKGGRLFRVNMKASETNALHFAHPIPAYGTELLPAPDRGKNSGLNVHILTGKKTTTELVQAISSLTLGSQPTIFLLDWSIPLGERREMARELKQDSACPATAIVVDRVLMLFLACYPQAERTQVLLQCALPFHSYNPYTEGDVSPEMFMGRDAQLKSILRNGEANIIYGGRQLGKTALLRRAATLVDDRSKGNWAIYTDKICRQDYQKALVEVYKCLYQNGFLDEIEEPKDWSELCDRIQDRMNRPENRVDRFLLLLDEADRFLESSSALSYRPVECLYQLETATRGRFKFVLAGLHNVMRFSRDGGRNNSVLGKLGSLTIKPLTFQEASQLLELPLYYIGFRMKPEQDVLLSQILLSTNYYPGLIQFYCRQLVDSLKARRASDDSTPPYQLDEGTIRNLLQKEDFVTQIREKFFITLDVEEGKRYYRALAYILAYCYYEFSEDSVEGYSFEQIREIYEGFEIESLCQLEAENVKTLLSEMEDLNVLVQMDGRYSFNGANFRHMMGDVETVMNELDRLGGEHA